MSSSSSRQSLDPVASHSARGASRGGAGGKLVWRDLDQAALDAAYDQSIYAPNRQQILDRYTANSLNLRARLGEPKRFLYGSGRLEGLDVYPARDKAGRTLNEPAPIQIFIHGGAWRSGTGAQYGFLSEIFTAAGAHVVIPDFDWVQDCGGDLLPLADQVQRAIGWVWQNAERFGGDRQRLYLSAHSSGAHLASVALTALGERFSLPADAIKGALLCSGMYELRPVRLSARSSYVTITDESEAVLSAERHVEAITTPLILAHGTLESPEFQRQTRDFAAAREASGRPVELLVAEHYNHFEILETLANPYGLLGRAALGQMGLA